MGAATPLACRPAVMKSEQGVVGAAGAVMTPDLQEALRRMWKEVVTPALGLADYEELLAWHRRRQQEKL